MTKPRILASGAEHVEYKLSKLLDCDEDLDFSQSVWKHLDRLDPKLRDRIMEANPSWDASSIPDRWVGIQEPLPAKMCSLSACN